MAGNKNSGRKSWKEELLINEVINCSWKTISKALASDEIDDKEKRSIALEIVKKSCPKEINVKSDSINDQLRDLVRGFQGEFQSNRLSSMALDS